MRHRHVIVHRVRDEQGRDLAALCTCTALHHPTSGQPLRDGTKRWQRAVEAMHKQVEQAEADRTASPWFRRAWERLNSKGKTP